MPSSSRLGFLPVHRSQRAEGDRTLRPNVSSRVTSDYGTSYQALVILRPYVVTIVGGVMFGGRCDRDPASALHEQGVRPIIQR